jgi:hypothetical protein
MSVAIGRSELVDIAEEQGGLELLMLLSCNSAGILFGKIHGYSPDAADDLLAPGGLGVGIIGYGTVITHLPFFIDALMRWERGAEETCGGAYVRVRYNVVTDVLRRFFQNVGRFLRWAVPGLDPGARAAGGTRKERGDRGWVTK